MANRLAAASSPYLLQHQHNPVDWYPWGEEAFAEARRRDVPIFLSIGYSTCYWCHVMERQCFENPQIAAEMNRRFVNVKVDREEHPDVDQIYMTAVQVLVRHGGWPLSVFLTPDLRPFFGGTYFPPEDMPDGRGGLRPGFPRVLESIDDAWRNRREQILRTADQLLSILHQLSLPRPLEVAPAAGLAADADGYAKVVWGREKLGEFVSRSASDYEPVYGGFGRAPKFPRQTLLRLLARFGDVREHRMLVHTLAAMARGGIRDHLGGGFHRYSTDAKWLVPHFEIMLYDQAMLAEVYAMAATASWCPSGDAADFADVARGVCDFVLREMTSPEGAFYTALDAEVDGREGENYLWTAEQIRHVLGEADAALFNCIYGVDQGPNFRDPHHPEDAPRNILFLDRPLAQAAFEHGIAEPELRSRLAAMREKLKAVRDRRKGPRLDDKVLTGWNALMSAALARCGRMLGERRYVEAAERNVRWLLSHHVTDDGRVRRGSRAGVVREEPAVLDDYAALAEACLAVAEAVDGVGAAGHGEVGGAPLREAAGRLAGEMLRRFGGDFADGGCGQREAGEEAAAGCAACCGGDAANGSGCRGCRGGGGLFYTQDDAPHVIVRQKLATDSPLPSGNALAAGVLLRLGEGNRAAAILADFAQATEDNAEAMSALVERLGQFIEQFGPLELTARVRRPGAGEVAADSPASAAREAVGLAARFAEDGALEVRIDIAEGHYCYAAEGRDVRPLRLELEGVRFEYPPGVRKTLVPGEEPVEVYEGAVVLRGTVVGSAPWKGVLMYQACVSDSSGSRCLMPVVRPVEIDG
ncbi:MAG: DUF255 domain-containing protein [Tepidisphaerales bacterium]